DLDEQDGQHAQYNPAREIACKQQKAQKKPEDDGEVEQGVEHYHQRQTDPREAELLQQVGVLQKYGLAATQNLGEQAPGEQACAEVDAIGEIVVHARQARPHELGEDHRVDDDHRQRIDDGPQSGEQGVAIATLELPLHAAQHEAAVMPQRVEQGGGTQDTQTEWASSQPVTHYPRYAPHSPA